MDRRLSFERGHPMKTLISAIALAATLGTASFAETIATGDLGLVIERAKGSVYWSISLSAPRLRGSKDWAICPCLVGVFAR